MEKKSKLTFQQIISERPEIEKQVFEKIPVSKRERTCWVTKSQNEYDRWQLAKQLYEATPGKREYGS